MRIVVPDLVGLPYSPGLTRREAALLPEVTVNTLFLATCPNRWSMEFREVTD